MNKIQEILYQGLDIMEYQEIRDNLLIIERRADYRSFFHVESFLQGVVRGGSDHVPLFFNHIMSYNILCAGSPNGLIYEGGDKYVEERDYTVLNPRSKANLDHVFQWVSQGNLALIQELSLNIKAYLPQDPHIKWSFQRTKACKFYHGIFYDNQRYQEEHHLSDKIQKHVDGLKYHYRSQLGRILVTFLKDITSSKHVVILNMHLAPGGRSPLRKKDFCDFFTLLIDCIVQHMKNQDGCEIILAGDINQDPFCLWDIQMPSPWRATLIYAPDSCQSYWQEKPQLSTNDLIFHLVYPS